MKTQIGVGAAVLAALAAEGKNFDRDELNAMLDKLAASPEPKVKRGPTAMCYSISMARPEPLEYVCEKCGTHTVYPQSRVMMANLLARYRDGVASLRALGLDIALDESALCKKCRSAKELKIPMRAKIVGRPRLEREKERFHWKIGEEVLIESYGTTECKVRTINPEGWIRARDISETGEVLGYASIWWSPPSAGKLYGKRGGVLKRLPARPSDPKGWVRVDLSDIVQASGENESLRTKFLGDFSYEEDDGVSLGRFERLAWIINGKRTFVSGGDIDILRAFLSGEKLVNDDDEHPLKRDLPRLRELLGAGDGKCRTSESGGVDSMAQKEGVK